VSARFDLDPSRRVLPPFRLDFWSAQLNAGVSLVGQARSDLAVLRGPARVGEVADLAFAMPLDICVVTGEPAAAFPHEHAFLGDRQNKPRFQHHRY
jgi:hypothetical protein